MSDKRASSDRRAKREAVRQKTDRSKESQESSAPRNSIRPDHEEKLRARLKTAEETLAAIQSGEVDALMVSGRRGEQVVTLKGGEPAYRMLVEAMSEGAATLSSDGAVLYSNRKFAEMIRRPPGKVVGIAVPSLVEETERDRFETVPCNGSERGCERRIQPALERRESGSGPFVSEQVSGIRGPRPGHGGHRSERAKTQAGRGNQTGRNHAPASAGAHAFGSRGGKAPDCARIARRSWSVADVSSGRPAYSGRLPEHSRCQGKGTSAAGNHGAGYRRGRPARPRASSQRCWTTMGWVLR